MAVQGYTTLRLIVYDLLNKFKQVHVNANISPYQMTYWVLVHADRLKKLHVEKRDSGAYVTPFDVNTETVDGVRRFELPSNIYDMDRDGGIEYIVYGGDLATDPRYSDVRFTRTTPAKARRLYYHPEEEPSPDNPYFYRLGDYIYLLGEDETVSEIEVGLYMTFSPTDNDLDLDQMFDFPQDLIPILERHILDMGSWAMNVPKNRLNDPIQGSDGVPDKKWTSVDEFRQEDEEEQQRQRQRR